MSGGSLRVAMFVSFVPLAANVSHQLQAILGPKARPKLRVVYDEVQYGRLT
jgi:hypothetical protein